MLSNCYNIQLLSLLLLSSYGIKVAYLDGDAQLHSATAISDKIRTQLRQFDLPTVPDRKDINPRLSGGVTGLPGIAFRINIRGFSYASLLARPIISNEIKQMRLPATRQCSPQFNGCITMYNLFISRYRCPQLVSIYPSPLNRLIVTARNFDFGITGNLGGEIEVILPITLAGIVHISVHQVSITTQLTLHHAKNEAVYARIIGCYVSVGFTDVVIQNGGLVGDVFNTQFRGAAAEHLRRALPTKICAMLPKIIREKINQRLRSIPQMIQFNKVAGFIDYMSSIISYTYLPTHCRTPLCQKRIQESNVNISHDHGSVSEYHGLPDCPGIDNTFTDPIPKTGRINSHDLNSKSSSKISTIVVARNRRKRQASDLPRAHRLVSVGSNQRSTMKTTLHRVTLPPMSSESNVNALFTTTLTQDPCSDCYRSNRYFQAALKCFRNNMALKLSDLMLNLRLMKTSATPNDFTFGLSGEFSPKNHGGSPFHPFPMYFPRSRSAGNRMAEILVSDFSINTLLYHMHKRKFIIYHIGPQTPTFGELLKTTCSDEDYDDFDDFDFDEDESFDEANSTTATTTKSQKSRKRRKRHNVDEESDNNESNLSDFGVCLGDVMPAIREKYPNKSLYIKVHTTRAPSVILSARNGGKATITVEADALLYIEGSDEKAGTVGISTVLDAAIRGYDSQITGVVEIVSLKLIDKENTLGLPQDALDNLASLSKDISSKLANNALSKGLVIQLPTGKLPYSFVKPQMTIVDHAIHIAFDFRISPSAIGIDSSSICR